MNSTSRTLRSTLFLLAGLAAVLTPAKAANPPAAAAGSDMLQVQVNVPPSWQPMFEDRVSEAFVSHLSDVFQRQGYKGQISELRSTDKPTAGCCLLTINLVEWRMDPIGNIQCTFTADLQTDHGARHLPGTFNGMAIRWMSGPGRFGFSDSLGAAAEDAIRQLYDTMAKTELIPGLRKS